MKPGLERMKSALKLIPSFKNTKIVTIAGTNGKGETTLRLSHLLKNESHCTWISPHIYRITERFRDENGEISLEELENHVHSCHDLIQKSQIKLSYYEFLFFVFCFWAQRKNPKYLLLEVGLGGRLDAVNVFDADLVLLPSISRDHQEYLGNSYASILKEKLALVRSRKTLLSYVSLQYLREKTVEFLSDSGAEIIELEDFKLHLPYEFSLRNQTLARAAFLFLSGESLEELKNLTPDDLSLEARGEALNKNGEHFLFGSHNVDGVRKLIQFLHRANYNFSRPPYDAVVVAFSQRNEEDLRVMLKMLSRSGLGKVIITFFPHPKALSMEVAQRLSKSEGLEFVSDLEIYLKSNKPNQNILVAGSYYFLAYYKSLVFGF